MITISFGDGYTSIVERGFFMWKKRIAAAVVAIMAVGLIAGRKADKSGSASGNKTYKIGVVQLVEHPALDAANKGFVDGLASKGFKDNVQIDQQNAQADQSNLNSIAQRFVADKKGFSAGNRNAGRTVDGKCHERHSRFWDSYYGLQIGEAR